MLALAGWIAPVATMVAAVMTASNLGARVTGWGFAIFAVGAVAWIVVGVGGGQRNLVLTNAFLLLIDLVGVWRWLGLRARYEAGASHANARSARAASPTLFPLSRLEGATVRGRDGAAIATTVGAMARCDDGQIDYVVVREGGVGGVGERLHALAWRELRVGDEAIESDLAADELARRADLPPERWPSAANAG